MPLYRFFLVLTLISLSITGRAQLLIAGGEVSYKFLNVHPGGFGELYYKYQLTVKLYKECQEQGNVPNSVDIQIYHVNPPAMLPTYQKYQKQVDLTLPQTAYYVTKQDQNACSPDQQPICYVASSYSAEIDLMEDIGEYLVYIQSDRRKTANFVNVSTDGIGKLSGGVMGFTYSCRMPGMVVNVIFPYVASPASSPVFKKEYPLILCAGKQFSYDFSANDPDGDSLSYQFVPAMQGQQWQAPRYPVTATAPPFVPLFYYSNFTGAAPLGPAVQIDLKTGRISGVAPSVPGRYLAVIEVSKYRKGQYISRHTKEMQFLFSNCTFPKAQLDSSYKNCKGSDVHFTNYSTGQIASYTWNFGDPTTLADTSHLAEPDYHYPAPGTYTAWLYLNIGTSLCKDSVSCQVVVDSGMKASFNLQRVLAACNEATYDFTNTSTSGANPNTSYTWDFGEPSTNTDISSLLNPTYTYPTDGLKPVRLIIKNGIGCADTAFKNIQAFKSLMQAPNDTTICYLDPIVLRPNTNGYPGTFSWSPNYNISSLTSANPTVNPQVDTTYHVSFTDATGCVALDSVRVKVRKTVNMAIDNIDTTICKLDIISLNVTHDGLNVTWNPSSVVTPVNPDGSSVNAFPGTTMPLIATAHFGSCFASDTIKIKVVPQPFVTVNGDTTVCFGAPVYLHATGGTFYLWTPAASLDNPVIANPVAHPTDPKTIYTVSVYDTLGCPKHTIAYVKVNAFRGLIAHAEKDTMVVEGEPVQLQGYGGQYYHWSPSSFLSDAAISNPVATSYGDITYVLSVSNDDHCVDKDSVSIRAFKDPDIYTPTAFTPNNDGRNDIFKVFPVGFDLKELKIFNRWGNVVFATTDYTKGWNGKLNGVDLASGTFVWVATGKNSKTGAAVTKKGLVTLIR